MDTDYKLYHIRPICANQWPLMITTICGTEQNIFEPLTLGELFILIPDGSNPPIMSCFYIDRSKWDRRDYEWTHERIYEALTELGRKSIHNHFQKQKERIEELFFKEIENPTEFFFKLRMIDFINRNALQIITDNTKCHSLKSDLTDSMRYDPLEIQNIIKDDIV